MPDVQEQEQPQRAAISEVLALPPPSWQIDNPQPPQEPLPETNTQESDYAGVGAIAGSKEETTSFLANCQFTHLEVLVGTEEALRMLEDLNVSASNSDNMIICNKMCSCKSGHVHRLFWDYRNHTLRKLFTGCIAQISKYHYSTRDHVWPIHET